MTKTFLIKNDFGFCDLYRLSLSNQRYTLKSIKLVEPCIRIELDIDYNAGFIATPMVMPSEQWVILAEINRSDLKYRYIESEYTIYNFNIL